MFLPKTIIEFLPQRRRGLTAHDVRAIVHGEMAHFLRDVEFRVAQAYDVERRTGSGGKVYAEDLVLQRHALTGYTVTNNTPAAGSIAWTSLHVVYNGTDYLLTDGNTAARYAWFAPGTSATIMQTSNVKPTLLASDTLVFVNDGGIARVAVDSSIPAAVGNNSIDAAAILAGAVGAAAIAAGAVGGAALAAGAVGAGKIAAGAVGSPELAGGAVTLGKISGGAVEAGNLAGGSVTGAALAAGAVGTTALADGSITGPKVGVGQIGGAQIADGSVSTAELGAQAVQAGNIGTGQVGATQLGAGAITAPKLNILNHVLY
jgi:hypothetical protein